VEDKDERQDRRGTRIGGGGGDVRRAAIRALPTGAEVKSEVLVFGTRRFRFLKFSPRDVTHIQVAFLFLYVNSWSILFAETSENCWVISNVLSPRRSSP